MTTNILKRNEALDCYFRSLSNKERLAKSRDIRETLGISRFILYDWRRGRTPIRPSLFNKIIEIVGVDLNSYIGN